MMEETQRENEQMTIETNTSKEDSNGVVIDGECNGEEQHSDIRPYVSFQEKCLDVLHSHKFQLGIIALVIFDCLLVIAEMLLDLHGNDPEQNVEQRHNQEMAAHILHYFSIGILSVFIVELMFKLYAYRLDFFQHKLEIFDAFVVLLSFALDVAFINNSSASVGSGLIVILRLWRVARILNGIVLSVKTQAEHKLAKERRLRDALEQERFQNQEHIVALEQEVDRLRKLLQENNISLPSKSPKPPK